MAKDSIRPPVASKVLWREILVPMDFSPPSEAAFKYATQLAQLSNSLIHVCHIIPTPHVLDLLYEHGYDTSESVKRIQQRSRQRITELLTADGDDKVQMQVHVHFSEGEATTGVLDWVTTLTPDLVVIGTHGRQGAKRFFMGSVAEYVVRHAQCPVLTIRALPNRDDKEPQTLS